MTTKTSPSRRAPVAHPETYVIRHADGVRYYAGSYDDDWVSSMGPGAYAYCVTGRDGRRLLDADIAALRGRGESVEAVRWIPGCR